MKHRPSARDRPEKSFLGKRKSVIQRGEFLQVSDQSIAEKRKGRGPSLNNFLDLRWIGRADRIPCLLAGFKLLPRDRLPAVKMTLQWTGRNRPQVILNAHQTHPRVCMVPAVEPVKNLDQLKLIVQVALKPEHDFIMRTERLEHLIAAGEIIKNGFLVPPSLGRDIAGPHLTERLEGETRRDRSFVKGVTPRTKLPIDAGEADLFKGGVAIRDVEHTDSH